MFVQKLVLKNFKSFKGTPIHFGKGFNAVVGPNGSGKSNLIDALLFAFGESSLKSMRVKRTADLIFGGANVAEVTVTLRDDQKNETHEVKRFIRKDGKTKYVLDGKRTQRYNVEDFLAAHALSLNNIIKQGEVQRIVEMNAKERRGLIDTVANISEYEDKKKEALSELSKVEDRLKEAATVLGAKEGYLGELKKEREDALRHQKLKAELDAVKVTLLSIDAKDYEGQFESLVAALLDANNKAAAASTRISELEAKIAELQSQRDAVNHKILESGEGRQLELQKQIDALALEIDRAKNLAASKQDLLEKSDEKRRALKQELQRAEDEAKGYERQLKDVEAEVASTRALLATAQAEYEKLLGQSSQFSAQFHDARKTVQECEAAQLACKDALNALQAETGKNQEIKAWKERELEKLKRGAFGTDEHGARRKELEAKRKDFARDAAPLERKAADVFKKEKALNERLPAVDDLLLAAKEKLALIQSRLKHAREDASDRAREAVMDYAHKNKLKGVHGPLEALCTFESRYAVPVQVALGPRLGFVVVDSVKTASACITYLKQNKIGRVSFIPLDRIHAPDASVAARQVRDANGCLGFLLDFLKFDDRVARAFRYACGDTLVFDALKHAEPHVGKARLVTMDGELAEPSGLLAGGTASSRVNPAIERKALEEWEAKAAALKREKDAILSELQDVREELAAVRKQRAELDLKEKTIDIELAQIAKQEDALAAAKQNVAQAVADLQADVKALDKAIADAGERRAALIRQLSDLNLRLLDAKQVLDVEKQEKLGATVAQKERRLSELKISLSEFENQARALATQKAVYQKQADALRRDVDALEKELGEAGSAIKAANHEAKEKQAVLREKLAEQKAVEGASTDLIRQREKLEKETMRLANDKGKIEFERENVLRDVGANELKKAVLGEKLSALKAELAQYGNAEPLRGKTAADKPELLTAVKKLTGELDLIGPVNAKAIDLYAQRAKDFEEQKARVQQILTEKEAVIAIVNEIERKKTQTFLNTFNDINANFERLFRQIFEGNGRLFLENPERPLEGGLTIEVRLENKEVKYLELMSGGEKSLIALMFLFSLQAYNPSSIYILDEADAALDQENSRKLAQLIRELSRDSQFLLVSHNQSVYQNVDCLVGVAMTKTGSQLVEVKLDKKTSA